MTRLVLTFAVFFLPAGVVTAAPNVLFLFMDDQQADTVAALGNPHIKTPNLDRLAARGTAFRRAYMQGGLNGATCVPSRSMLLTSRTVFRADEKMLRDDSWPAAFAKAGYATFHTGKWHNGPASLPKCFLESRRVFAGGMTNPLKAPLSDLVEGKLTKATVGDKHACAVFADEAVAFLGRKHEKPFFCYVAFDGPHDPHIVPPGYAVTYDPEKLPLPPNFLERHPFDNGEMNVRDEKLLPTPRPKDGVRKMIAEYYRYVSYLDEQVGRILEALDKSPHAKDTIVVFTADSGVARGQHGLIGKQNLYEHSVRVPMIVAGPGIAANKQSDAMLYLYDVMPTLGAMCGVAGPKTSEGLDLSAAFKDATKAGRPRLVFAYRGVQRAMREGRWKLIRYPKVDRVQLFDLEADPHETTDLSGKAEHAGRVKEMSATMAKDLAAVGDKGA